jgi:plastocyanin
MVRRLSLFVIPLIAVACANSDAPGPSNTVAAVVITTSTATLRPGETSQFIALGVDANGNEVTGAGTASWSTAAASVASVNQTGLVTAVAPGSATISAVIEGISGSRLVTVLPAGASAVVTMPGFSFIPAEVTVHRGESVYFEFPREPHNVIFANTTGAPQDITLPTSNVTIPRTFTTTGQFAYDCTLHPGMSGVVIVTP